MSVATGINETFFLVDCGDFVDHAGEKYEVTHLLSVNSLLAKHAATGEVERLRIENIKPWTEKPAEEAAAAESVVQTRSKHLHDFTEEEWQQAQRKLEAIKPLLADPLRTRTDVEKRAEEFGVHPATLYEWMRTFQRSGHVSSLVSERRGRKPGVTFLTHEQEKVIESVIDDVYLTPQKGKPADVIAEVERRCRLAKLEIPHANTVRSRIKRIDPAHALRKRGRRDLARNRHDPILGEFPGADFPLAVVQIDHTEADIILVDEQYRQPIGRPWLTLAIDVYSRMVVGVYMSFEHPSAASVGVCVANAMCPKSDYLARLGVGGDWPVWGKMTKLHSDNGPDLRGSVVERACDDYDIDHDFRPAARPHMGGHIERLMGTVANELRKLPGATFSNPSQRKGYNSEKRSAMTLKEFESWLVDMLVNIYHVRVHGGIGRPPLTKWTEGILGNDERPGRGMLPIPHDSLRVLLDFMPFTTRTVQPYGLEWDNIFYYDPILDPFIGSIQEGNPKVKKKYLIRRVPTDISRVYFFNPVENRYEPVAYRNQGHPAISVWELNEVKARLKAEGAKDLDEERIFEAIERQRQRVEASVSKTKAARRKATRVPKQQNKSGRQASEASTPAHTIEEEQRRAMTETGPAGNTAFDDADLSALVPFDEIS